MSEKLALTANILFSGIGCQERGMTDTGLFDVKVNITSDINKEAILSYAAVHCGLTNDMVENYKEYPTRETMAKELKEKNIGYEPEKNEEYDWGKHIKKKSKELNKYWLAMKLANNLGDISRIEKLPYADLWTISFPCQSISSAGKMKGFKKDSGTRSSLLWENIRLLKQAKEDNTLPKYLMFENVKNLVSKKFIADFNDLLNILSEIGFNTYWKVLDAKDCGIPQHRERVFVICIRQDIDTKSFEFPKPYDIGIKLKHILDSEIDETYYLSENIQKRFQLTDATFTHNVIGTTKAEFRTIGQRDLVYNTDGIMSTLLATDYKQPKQIYETRDRDNSKKVEDQQYIDNITSTQIFVKRKLQELIDKKGYLPEMFNAYNCAEINDFAPTLTITCGSTSSSAAVLKKEKEHRIRKLTPFECWKLMGFSMNDCKKAKEVGNSDTQLYKQAGNGIVTNCVELIMEHLYKSQYDSKYVCTDELLNGKIECVSNK